MRKMPECYNSKTMSRYSQQPNAEYLDQIDQFIKENGKTELSATDNKIAQPYSIFIKTGCDKKSKAMAKAYKDKEND